MSARPSHRLAQPLQHIAYTSSRFVPLSSAALMFVVSASTVRFGLI